jgi:hypothetical protein
MWRTAAYFFRVTAHGVTNLIDSRNQYRPNFLHLTSHSVIKFYDETTMTCFGSMDVKFHVTLLYAGNQYKIQEWTVRVLCEILYSSLALMSHLLQIK